MFKRQDPYTFVKMCTLFHKVENDDKEIGTLFVEYQITSFDDVRLKDANSINKNRNPQFLVHCTQKINLINTDGISMNPYTNLEMFLNYPLLINTSIEINNSKQNLKVNLLDYSPQTINTKIQSSGAQTDSSGVTQSSSNSSTVGSTTSETNSYTASVTISENPSASATYEHSSTVTNENSNTKGNENSKTKGAETSNSANLTIKDWGAYGLVNPKSKSPIWSFGQEYPFDVINCRSTTGEINPHNNNQVQIILPSAMTIRLYDGVTLYPPSQLSMFGVNFVTKAFWLVTIDSNIDEIEIDHDVNYFSGSHMLTGDSQKSVVAYMDSSPQSLYVISDESLATTLNLPLMALDPVGLINHSAIVGFIPNKFTVLPSPSTTNPPVAFKLTSTTNDLIIKDTTTYPSSVGVGAGFMASQTALTATFSANCLKLEITAYFKIIDTSNNYTLFLKHWIKDITGVKLTISINGDKDNAITKYVDSKEAEGGDNNLLSIVLRNQDFASVDYHDYLQLGLNSINLTIEPINPANYSTSIYQIRAVSIERD